MFGCSSTAPVDFANSHDIRAEFELPISDSDRSIVIGGAVDDADSCVGGHELVGTAQHFLCVPAIGRYSGGAEFRSLPHVVVTRLCDGHVVASPEPVLQAPEYSSLLLERSAPLEMQLPSYHAYDHDSRAAFALFRLCAHGTVELARDMLDAERLEDIAHFDVVEILDGHTAFVAGLDLLHIFLEAF